MNCIKILLSRHCVMNITITILHGNFVMRNETLFKTWCLFLLWDINHLTSVIPPELIFKIALHLVLSCLHLHDHFFCCLFWLLKFFNSLGKLNVWMFIVVNGVLIHHSILFYISDVIFQNSVFHFKHIKSINWFVYLEKSSPETNSFNYFKSWHVFAIFNDIKSFNYFFKIIKLDL